MPIRRLLGLVLIAASYWVLRGRLAAMQFEVNAGNSWGGVLSDVEYLIPGLGALLAVLGGVLAAFGASGKWLAALGTFLLVLFLVLVGVMSGMFAMVQPFIIPALVMLAATIGLFVLRPK